MLKQPLLITRGRMRILSPLGESLKASLRPVFDQFTIAYRTALMAGTEEVFHLKVGGRRELLAMLPLGRAFKGHLELVPMSGHEAVRSLLEQRLDIAISYERPSVHHVKAKKLATFGTKLIVHRRFTRGHETPGLFENSGFLSSCPWLAYDPDADFIERWHKACGLRRPCHEPSLICPDWSIIVRSVIEGRGFAIVPDNIEAHGAEVYSEEVPSRVIPARTYYMIYQSHLTKYAPVMAFLAASKAR